MTQEIKDQLLLIQRTQADLLSFVCSLAQSHLSLARAVCALGDVPKESVNDLLTEINDLQPLVTESKERVATLKAQIDRALGGS